MTAGPHWGDGYYGALYLESVADLLSPRLSELEAEVVASLLGLGERDLVLDLGCGHGRHAAALLGRARALVGLDRSADYLRRAAAGPARAAWVRGDVRALPFAAGAFDAAFSWYASLFMFDDATNLACLAEAARVVRRGGRLLVHHANPLRLARAPRESASRALADGSVVEEACEFDARRGVDRCVRRLVRPGGAVLAGTAELRYYSPSEWERLAARAGLRLLELTDTASAGGGPRPAPGPDAPDLISILEKPT